MQVFMNERKIKVNSTIGRWSSLAGLGVLVVGLVISFRNPSLSWVSMVCLIVGFLSSTVSLALCAQGIGVALVLGLVGGAYPAWRASRLLPAEAMRAESGTEVRASRLRFGGAPMRNLLRQRTRTVLTLTGIGIAIMAMVGLGGLADGLADEMTAMAGKTGFHLVGMEADASIDLSAIDQGIVRRIAAIPGVEHAEGFLTGYTGVGDLPFFVVFGYHPQSRAISDFRIVEGMPLTANRQVIIGRVAAEALNKRVGQTIRFFDTTFRIVGIYETGVPFEDGGGVITLRNAQTLFGQPHKVSFLGVRLENPDQAETVERAIEARFPEVALSQESEFAEDVTDLQFMRSSTWAIAFLALLVGGAGMTNTMVMSVFERTREIGVLRALGWCRWRVQSMILRESLALSLLGGVVGLITGVVFIRLLNKVPVLAGFVKAQFSAGLFGQALVTALVLGIIGGAYPAWRASRMQPVEALRYE